MKNINCKCINQYHCCTKKPKTFFIFYRSCCEFYGEKCDIAERWERPKGPPPPPPPVPKTLKCKIFGHKLGWEIFDPRPCKRTGCDHVEPARERPPCPPMPKHDFYYSEQQKAVRLKQALIRPHAIINNKCIEYTEMTEVGKNPSGIWEDYVFLGTGRINQ